MAVDVQTLHRMKMDKLDLQNRFFRLFTTLRQSGFQLGVGELLAALKVADGDFEIEDLDDFYAVARLLWCTSPDEQQLFDTIRKSISADDIENLPLPRRYPSSSSQSRPEPVDDADQPLPSVVLQSQTFTETMSLEWTTLPVYAPFMPTATEYRYELLAYWPISSRSMAYAWRYLRRPIADGPEDVLDVDATVERVAQQGFFLAPVYRRRERNHAHLLLLVDQGGSMVPMHRFSRDLIETAQPEHSGLEYMDVLYFQNVPGEYLYADPHLTKSVSRTEMFAHCGSDTSVLIVSDAGAARGHRSLKRIQATTETLFHLKRYTNLIAWLNPMPQERWPGSSAQIIAHLIPMYQMDLDGFNNAIDVVRGQPFHHYR